MYYTLAHFDGKPHISQNYMVPEKFQSKNGKTIFFNFPENYIFSILWLNKIFSNSWKSIPGKPDVVSKHHRQRRRS